jgi:uncharacterized protein YjdB
MRPVISFAVLVVMAAGCSDYASEPRPTRSVVVSPALDTLEVNSVRDFNASVYDTDGNLLPSASVQWRSSNSNVVSVHSASGFASAVAVGSAYVIADSEGAKDSARVVVIGAR